MKSLNLEALTPACLNNCAKTWIRHTNFYSTLLYARHRKETFKPSFFDWGRNKVILRTGSKRVLILH